MNQSPSSLAASHHQHAAESPSPLLAQSPELAQPGLDSSASPSVASSHSFDQLAYPSHSEQQDLVPFYPSPYGADFSGFTSDPIGALEYGPYFGETVYVPLDPSFTQIDESCQTIYTSAAVPEFYNNQVASSSMPYLQQLSHQTLPESAVATSHQLIKASPTLVYHSGPSSLPVTQRHAPVAPPTSVVKGHRFNPMASGAQLQARRHSNPRTDPAPPSVYQPVAPVVATAAAADFESDDDDVSPVHGNSNDSAQPGAKRENIKKLRIESEQRRRDELRDGYKRLKDALPPSAQKASKAAVLDRATTHLNELNKRLQEQLELVRVKEAEISRLQKVNEQLMLSTAEHKMLTAKIAAHQAYGHH